MERSKDVLKDAVAYMNEHTSTDAYAYIWNKLISNPPADVAEGLSSLLHLLERATDNAGQLAVAPSASRKNC